MAPEISIMAPPGPFHRRVRADFRAVSPRESLDGLSFRWGHLPGACPSPFSVDERSDQGNGAPTFGLTPGADELGTLCVWVEAENDGGVRTLAKTEIVVQDRPPVATVTQLSPDPGSVVRLGTNVVIQVEITDADGDDVTHLAPILRAPSGMDGAFSPCEPAAQGDSDVRCFVVTSPGRWEVSVGPKAPQVLKQTQIGSILAIVGDEDQAPCLGTVPASAILVQDASKPLRLEASVHDDLDSAPAPSSQATFLWSVADRADGPFLADIDNKDRFKVIGENRYRAGDELRVRIDVADRVPRVSACRPGEDTCGTPQCKQRMTWKVQFR